MVRQKGGHPGREYSGGWGTDWEGVELESMGDAAQKARRPAGKCTGLGKKDQMARMKPDYRGQ